MNCADVQEQLELFVLDDLPADRRDAVRAHLAACPDCEDAVARCRRVTARLVRAARPDRAVRLDLARRVSESAGREIRAARRRARLRSALAGLAAVAAAALLAVGLWQTQTPTDPDSRIAAPGAVAVPASPVRAAPQALRQLWQQPGIHSAPMTLTGTVVVHEHRVYLLRNEGPDDRVAALDEHSGGTLWTAELPSIGHISAGRGRVYCLTEAPDGQTELAAMDAADGRLLWRYRPDDTGPMRHPVAAVVVGEDRVCWSTNNGVHLIDAGTGQAVWRRTIQDSGLLSAAAAAGDRIYVVGAGGLYCLSVATGQVDWQLALDDGPLAPSRPLLDAADGRLFASVQGRSGASRVMCIAPDRRRTLWTRRLGPVLHLLPRDGRLFVRGQEVAALDGATGEPLWRRSAAGCSPITYDRGVVYFVDAATPVADGDSLGSLIALDGRTGRQTWHMPGPLSCEAFLTAGATGFLKTRDGMLHALAMRQI